MPETIYESLKQNFSVTAHSEAIYNAKITAAAYHILRYAPKEVMYDRELKMQRFTGVTCLCILRYCTRECTNPTV